MAALKAFSFRRSGLFTGEAAVPPGLRVFAVGDIHGRADLLEEMLRLIDEDCRREPPAERRIVFLGDYADRGPDSRAVIERLMLLVRDPAIICIRGNHDDWLLDFMVRPEAAEPFLKWGGRETLRSYGVDAGEERDNAEMAQELIRQMPMAHRRFLANLVWRHIEGDYFFCHAGVRPGVPVEEQDPFDLMWIRQEFHNHKGSFGKVIVHGHTPGAQVEILPNRINVDTRAYESGVLSCVVLEGKRHRILEARGAPQP